MIHLALISLNLKKFPDEIKDFRTNLQKFMERIFISYKRANKDKVYPLVERIEKELGVKCWVDLDGIESSAQFASKICTAIDNADVVLFMHSSIHLDIDFENDWTIDELNYAHSTKKRVLLVKLDDAPLKNIFLMKYGAKNNIDSNVPEQMEKMFRDLRGWLKLGEADNVMNLLEQGDECCRNKDYAQAVVWYEKAAEKGSARAQYCLGNHYYDGMGVKADLEKAARLYRTAAEHGYERAQYNYGLCCELGDGVPADNEEAVKWYKKSAEQGFARAQCYLADCYRYGIGIEENLQEAIAWYKKAEAQGDEDAKKQLGILKDLGVA